MTNTMTDNDLTTRCAAGLAGLQWKRGGATIQRQKLEWQVNKKNNGLTGRQAEDLGITPGD